MNNDFTILLAEDDENDVYLVKRALNWADIHNTIHVACDGNEAIAYLRGDGQYADREKYPLPSLALLDIKMPGKTGLEVLEYLRTSAENGLKMLPVIIMSSSTLQSDIDRAYKLGVNAYLKKPTKFDELVAELKTMSEFWKDTALLPMVAAATTPATP